MRKAIMVAIMVIFISSSLLSVGLVKAQEQDKEEALWGVINKLDIAASSLRKNDIQPALASIRKAAGEYESNLSPSISKVDNSLDAQIKEDFTAVSQGVPEEDVFSLRSKIIEAAALIDVHIPPVFIYSLFIVFAIGILVAFFTSYVSKRMVNWEMVKQNKAKMDEYRKELLAAQRKRDMKAVHKIQERQPEINQLQKEYMSQTFKPTIFIMVPLFLLWILMLPAFRGWVVAWMPFIRIDIPFMGPLVTFGVGWWYVLTNLGFSQIFRKIMGVGA